MVHGMTSSLSRKKHCNQKKKTECRNVPAPLFTINIAGPFLDDPFRWLAPAASPGLPGRGCAPVLLGLFIIETELF